MAHTRTRYEIMVTRVAVCEIVPAAAIVPALMARANQHYRGAINNAVRVPGVYHRHHVRTRHLPESRPYPQRSTAIYQPCPTTDRKHNSKQSVIIHDVIFVGIPGYLVRVWTAARTTNGILNGLRSGAKKRHNNCRRGTRGN